MSECSRQTRRGFLKTLAAGAAALALPRTLWGAGKGFDGAQGRPNIIFILADDLGWMDTSLYGSKYYRTPNIDRLAARGMMFTDAYAASPLCSPTRASIMTGKYPCRLGITLPAGHLPPLPKDQPVLAAKAAPWMKVICPQSRRFLPPEQYTIGEAFKDAGYATGFIGKWHLGLNAEHWPEKQGFDVSFHGAPDPGPPRYFSPYRFRAGTVTDGPKGEYVTDRVTDEAVKFIRGHSQGKKPFLLCLWHYAVHAPFQAKEAITGKYRGRTDPRGKQDCAVMAAMIQSLDEGVGRVLDELDRLKIAGETIIIFMSDNGGNMYSRVEGTTPTNNAPLRGGKGMIYEGGTREPCIIVWPGVVEPGSTSTEVIASVDFYPTMLEMGEVPARKDQIIDGVSIAPILKGSGGLDREAIFCHFPHYTPATGNLPATSVRKGDWKLIRLYGEGEDNTKSRCELYNLKDDIGERNDLAGRFPERVRELDALIARHLKETGAIVPVPNPAHDPKAKMPVGKARQRAARGGGAGR